MTCLEARKCIFSYLNKNLDEKEMGDFLAHLEGCPECMEELRITHMVYDGAARLDGNVGTVNMERDFQRTLDESRFFLMRKFLQRVGQYVLETLAFWGFVLALILQIRMWLERLM